MKPVHNVTYPGKLGRKKIMSSRKTIEVKDIVLNPNIVVKEIDKSTIEIQEEIPKMKIKGTYFIENMNIDKQYLRDIVDKTLIWTDNKNKALSFSTIEEVEKFCELNPEVLDVKEIITL